MIRIWIFTAAYAWAHTKFIWIMRISEGKQHELSAISTGGKHGGCINHRPEELNGTSKMYSET